MGILSRALGAVTGSSGLFGGINRVLFGREPSMPGRTPEEAALLGSQNELLRLQLEQLRGASRESQLLQPFLLTEAGVEPVRDSAGNITGYKRTAEGEQVEAIERKLRERTLAALEGNLPVDPALERGIDEGRLNLRESLRKQLGSGFETSTPGIEALENFRKRAEELRYGARTGQLTLSEQLSGAREAQSAQRFGNISSAGAYDLPFIQSGTTLASAFTPALRNLLAERELGAQADFTNYASRGRTFSTLANLFGTLFGAKKMG